MYLKYNKFGYSLIGNVNYSESKKKLSKSFL